MAHRANIIERQNVERSIFYNEVPPRATTNTGNAFGHDIILHHNNHTEKRQPRLDQSNIMQPPSASPRGGESTGQQFKKKRGTFTSNNYDIVGHASMNVRDRQSLSPQASCIVNGGAGLSAIREPSGPGHRL